MQVSTEALRAAPCALSLQDYIDAILPGDCCIVMRQFPANSIDLILTDPPYLINYRPRDGRSIAGDRSNDWLAPAFAETFRVLKRGGLCISFYGWSSAESYLAAWRQAGFRPEGHIVWIKSYASSAGLVESRHEQAYLLGKGSPRRPLSPISDVQDWYYTGNRLHPTQKPVRALLPLVQAFSRPGEIVLDPFCGSGSVPLAAKISGRRYIGIELRPDCCEIARQRLARK